MNIVERARRSLQVLYPAVRNVATFQAMLRTVRRFPQLHRVWTAHEQSERARDGKLTLREQARRAAMRNSDGLPTASACAT